MIDVVYIVRPGEQNEELRYSLRSLGNVPHGDVWIAGHRPDWVTGVQHLFTPQQDPTRFKYENATALLCDIAERGPDRFVLMNDDMFCLQRENAFPRPAHRGSLLALARERPGNYGQMLRSTAQLLAEGGIAHPLAYTLHKPLVMSRVGLKLALEHGLSRRVGAERLSWRSLYGNLMRLGGAVEEDVKVHGDGAPPAGSWISTSDCSFKYHKVGRLVRAALPNTSPFEQL